MITYAVLNFIDFLICVFLSLIVFGKGKDRSLVGPFFCWIIAVGIWSFGVGMHALSDISQSATAALFWSRFLHIGAVTLPVFYVHFVMVLCKQASRFLLPSLYGITVLFLILIPTKYFISGISQAYVFHFFPKIGPLYPLFVAFFSGCVIYSIFLLFFYVRKTKGIVRNQAQYVLLGSSIGYALGSTAFLPMFNISIFPFGTPFVILNGVLITYAIIRYRAMDLGLVMRWGIAYAGSLMVVLFFFLGVVYLFENFVVHFSILGRGIGIVAGLCLVTLFFDFFRRKISVLVDKFIFKSPDFQSMLNGVQEALGKAGSVDDVSANLVHYFKNIWNVNHAGFVVWNFNSTDFQLYPPDAFSSQSIIQTRAQITKNDFLVRTLETERRLFRYGIVVDEEISALISRSSPGEKVTFQKIRRTMRWVGAVVCVPLMLKDQLIGFIALGPKKNGSLYNEEDKKFLSHVAEMMSSTLRDLLLDKKIDQVWSSPLPQIPS